MQSGLMNPILGQGSEDIIAGHQRLRAEATSLLPDVPGIHFCHPAEPKNGAQPHRRLNAGTCALLLLSISIGSPAFGQSSAAPATAIGSVSAAQTASLTITKAGTVNAVVVVTQGATGSDFQLVPGGSCAVGSSYAVGDTCTVAYTFQPTAPGLRVGAVVLTDATNSELATTELSGIGNGAAVALSAGTITTRAGNHVLGAGYSGDGGAAISAQLNGPRGVAGDGAGNLYLADSGNNVIRKVSAQTGLITTVAGNGTAGYSGDGSAATSAQLNSPSDVAVDGAGNLYLADTGTSVIRKVSFQTGLITTVAGNGTAGYSGDTGAATSAQLNAPSGIALDGAGNLYIADTGNHVVREVAGQTGLITTVAGNGTAGYSGNTGAATSAQLNAPSGIALDGAGNLYIADTGNNVVREVAAATGVIATVAGTGTSGYSGDGGAAISALLNGPTSVKLDAAGDLYLLDGKNGVIREVSATSGVIATVAGNQPAANTFGGDGGPATSAGLAANHGFALDAAGNLYIADTGNNVVRNVNVSAASLSYPTPTPIGGTDTVDGAKSVVVSDIGNQSLSLSGVVSVPLDFPLDAGNACTASTTLAAASTCLLLVDFAPTITGSLAEKVTLTEGSSTQTIALSGTGKLATANITWATPAPITYGTPLSATQLNASSLVAGRFTYSPAAGALLTTGSQTLTVTFTPADTTKYSTTTASVTLTINKATPAITWGTPAAISYGTALSATQLNASSAVAGTLTYAPTAGTVLAPGRQTLSVNFSPSDAGNYNSATASVTLTVATAAATPTFSVAAGTYISQQSVAIADSAAGVSIYYTTDGTTPTTSSPTYTGPVTLNVTTTLKAIAVGTGYTQSGVASTLYTIQAAIPGFSESLGTYIGPQSIAISDPTPGSTIYYTTDGTTPTTNSKLYTGPVTVSTTTTLKAIALKTGCLPSVVATAPYTIQAATPIFSVAPGTYTGQQTVGISDATAGATIYYTADGSTPTTSSTLYTGPVTVSATTTLRAIATATGYGQSAVALGTYTLQVAKPTLSVATGTYTAPQSVAIADATAGASIYYTTDGTTPTAGSTLYTGPVSVNVTTTLKAIGVKSGFAQSIVATGVYTMQAATPTFNLATGSYAGTQTVAVADTTTGATIYYTADGSTVTTSSPIYMGPVTVSTTKTLKAMAIATGYSQSAPAAVTVTITASQTQAATPVFGVAAGTYTTPQTVTISDPTAGATIYYTTDGTIPTTGSVAYTGPVSVIVTTTLKAIAVKTGNTQSNVGTAVYTLLTATPNFSVTAGSYSSAQSVAIADSTAGATIYYTTDGTTPTTSSSLYSGPVTVSTNTTIKAIAIATGYAQSAVASASYSLQAAAPTFNLASGTYTTQQSVAIADSIPGASIYYTADGTTPTISSNLYSGPVTVNTTTTLKAIAVVTGSAASLVASAVYTIQAPVPVFSVPGATYAWPQTVTISDATVGTAIYYTVDGTTPTASSNLYSGPVTVNTTMTLKAIAVKPGWSTSGVATALYTLQAAPPLYSVPGGSYNSQQSVSISSATAGSTIYYTTDFTTPTTSSALYSAPVTVSTATTLKAIAIAPGFTQSAVASAAYTLQTAAPVFSPAAGLYTTPQSVTVLDLTPGVTIYYTKDGTTPTTSSAVYGGVIDLDGSATVKAIAVASGYTTSGVTTASYTINTPNVLTVDYFIDFESGNNGDAITLSNIDARGDGGCTFSLFGSGSHQTISTTGAAPLPGPISVNGIIYDSGTPSTRSYQFDPLGTTEVQSVQCRDLTGGYPAASFGLDYTTNSTTTKPLSIVTGINGGDGGYDTTHWSNGGIQIQTGTGTSIPITPNKTYWVTGLYQVGGNNLLYVFDPTTWQLVGTSSIPAGNEQIGNIFYFGRNGIDEHAGQGQWWWDNLLWSFKGTFPLVPHAIVANAPTYNQPSGVYSNSVLITIADIVPGSTILYCIDTTGTCTPSITYTAGVTMNTAGTNHLRSIATAPGWTNSGINDTTYTINGVSGPYVIQSASAQQSSTAHTLAFSSNVTAGDYVAVVVCRNDSATLVSITDSQSNTYTILDANVTSGSFGCTQGYAVASATGPLTVTANTSSRVVGNMAITEIANASGIDGHAMNHQSFPGTGVNAITSGNITTPNSNDLILGWANSGGSAVTTFTAGTLPLSYTPVQYLTTANVDLLLESATQPTAGTVSATATTSVGNIYVLAGVIAFHR